MVEINKYCYCYCISKVLFLFVSFFVCLNIGTFPVKFFFLENSTPMVFGIHQEQDDLKKAVASAGVAIIVGRVD